MAEREALELVVATFATPTGGARAFATLVPGLGGGLGLGAVVIAQADGKVRFVETHDKTAGQGALHGAGLGALGGIFALMLGPVALLGMPIGAAVGGLIGKLKDSGFDDEDLKALGTDLEPGTSAIVVTVDADQVEKARRLLIEVDAKSIVVKEVDAELADILDGEVPADVSIEPDIPPPPVTTLG